MKSSNIIPYSIIALLLILLLSNIICGRRENRSLKKELSLAKDSLSWSFRVDTVLVNVKDTVYRTIVQLQPYEVKVPQLFYVDRVVYKDGKEVPVISDSLIKMFFYSIKHYEDSVSTKFGKVVIRDTITQNTIAGRSVITDFDIPTTSKTIFVPEKQKAVLYFDMNAQFGKDRYYAGGVGFTLLGAKRKVQYSVDALVDRDNNLIYQGGLKLKIR